MTSFTRLLKKTFIFLFLLSALAGLYCQTEASSNPQPASAAGSDPYEELFFFARELYQKEALSQAHTELKRYIFMQDYAKGLHQTEAFTLLAQLYAKNSQWTLAAQSMQKAILSGLDSQVSEEEINHLRLLHIDYLKKCAQEEKLKLSEDLIFFSYMNLSEYAPLIRAAAYAAFFECSLKNQSWDYARGQFSQLLTIAPDYFTADEIELIKENLNNIEEYKPKKQMLAGYLSFFPGLGQFYAGNYKDSLNAFILNGSIIALSSWSICTLDLWTFSLLEFPPLLRFMKGNIYNAQKDVYEYNNKKLSTFTNPIFECLKIARDRAN